MNLAEDYRNLGVVEGYFGGECLEESFSRERICLAIFHVENDFQGGTPMVGADRAEELRIEWALLGIQGGNGVIEEHRLRDRHLRIVRLES